MPEPSAPFPPSDRRAVLESIAQTLRQGALTDPAEDLGAWVAGVEIVECLKRAGFRVVRHASAPVATDFVPAEDGHLQ